MAVQLAGILAPALAKVGAAKLPLLLRGCRNYSWSIARITSRKLGQAIVGGGLGALGTLGLGSATGMASKAATGAAVKGLGSKVFTPAGGALTDLARVAPALAIGGLAGGSAAGFLGGGARNIGKGAASLAGYGTVGGEGMGGSALPPGMGQFGGVSPTG